MAPSNRQLVQRSLAGDGNAFGDLVERFTPAVRAAVMQEIRDPDAVDDLVQDVFCQAFRRLDQLRSPERIAGWLGEIAHHTSVRWRWREHKRVAVEDRGGHAAVAAPRFAPPDEEVADTEERELLWGQIDRLEPQARQLILLRYVEGCSFREIARFLDVPIATAYFRMAKVERRLGRQLALSLSKDEDTTRARGRAMRTAVLGALSMAWSEPARASHAASWWMSRAVRWRVVATCVAISGAVHLGTLKWGAYEGGGELPVKGPADAAIEAVAFEAPGMADSALDGLPTRTAVLPVPGTDELPDMTAEPASVPDGLDVLREMTWKSLASEDVSEDLELLSATHLASAVTGLTTGDSHLPTAVELMSLRLDGQGSGSNSGNFLAELADHLRFECEMEVRVAGGAIHGFEHPAVLRTPIHFFLQGGGGPLADSRKIVDFTPREREQLSTYLSSGGLLYVEGDHRYLTRMSRILREQGPEGASLRELPVDHPLYRSWYTFTRGFPGEDKRSQLPPDGGPWYYPAERNTQSLSAPLGIWGVEDASGRLVAVLSDLPLFRGWTDGGLTDQDAEIAYEAPEHRPQLMAATNLVALALRQSGSMSIQRAAPYWDRATRQRP